jgi:hypothetical protein
MLDVEALTQALGEREALAQQQREEEEEAAAEREKEEPGQQVLVGRKQLGVRLAWRKMKRQVQSKLVSFKQRHITHGFASQSMVQ